MNASLAALQRAFLADMRGELPDAAIPHLAHDRGIPVDTGLSIYRNAYATRLREALDHDHPVLGLYLGDDLWTLMCDGYIAAHPSRVRSLRHFGESLPGYLSSAAPFSASPQIAELARLERRLLDTFDAADAGLAEWQQLIDLPEADWPGLRLRFHPSVQLLHHDWNSIEVWHALKAEETPPITVRESTHWLLWRDPGRITRFRSMATDESLALQHFLRGGDFAGACEALLAMHPAESVPALAIGTLRRWCEEGVVSRWLNDASECT